MKLQITTANKIENPPKNYGFAFIDEEDKKLKIKRHDSLIEFNNELSDFQLLNLCDYTAYEVYPHKNDIQVGFHEALNRQIRHAVPAQMIESFYIRSNHLQDQQNVSIDWGDGSDFTNLSDFTDPVSGQTYDYRYFVSHEYKEEGKYIIKIYGNTYYGLIHDESTLNLMSRCFDVDLPTASHLSNYSSFARCAWLLVDVDMFSAFNFIKNARNISNLFSNCQNIKSIKGFYNSAILINQQAATFIKTMRMISTDYKIPALLYSDGIQKLFYDNYQLNMDILDLLPNNGFIPGQTIDVTQAFHNCKKLSCSNFEKLGEIFWNNTSITFTNTLSCFSTCSDDFRSHIPIDWGGTKDFSNLEGGGTEGI
jgi:hypothetical protein